MFANEKTDWSQCALVEVKPHVQSGAVVLRDTRLPADAIVDSAASGMSAQEISKHFQLPKEQVEAILVYAKSHHINWFPYKSARRAYVAGAAGFFTLAFAFYSLWIAAHCPTTTAKILLTVAWGFWPPFWFILEHYIWFDNWGDHEAAKRFQDGRQLWAKLWAGVGAALVVLFKLKCP